MMASEVYSCFWFL